MRHYMPMLLFLASFDAVSRSGVKTGRNPYVVKFIAVDKKEKPACRAGLGNERIEY